MTEPDRQLRLIDLLKSGFFIKSMRPLRVVGRIQQYGPISFFSYKSQQSVVQFLADMMRLSLVGLIDEKLFKYSNIGAQGMIPTEPISFSPSFAIQKFPLLPM